MNDQDQPAAVRERIAVEVNRRVSDSNKTAWRATAVPIVLALLVMVYYNGIANDSEDYVFAAVLWLGAVLATTITLKFPVLVGARLAANDARGASTGVRILAMAPAVAMWSWPLTMATDSMLLGLAMVAALLPILAFVSNTVLHIAFSDTSQISTDVALAEIDLNSDLMVSDAERDAEAEDALAEHDSEYEKSHD